MIEAQVHTSLLTFLRQHPHSQWPHQLTMARLVARALRLGRSTMLQTGASFADYVLSYLTPALLGEWSVLLVVAPSRQQRLLEIEIPKLQGFLGTNKTIIADDGVSRWREGLMITSPSAWLADHWHNEGRFSAQMTTIIDGADDLETWTRDYFSNTIKGSDWQELVQKYPQERELIQDLKIRLTQAIFARPANPYQCYLLEKPEQDILRELGDVLESKGLVMPIFAEFMQRMSEPEQMLWVTLVKETGQWMLHLSAIALDSYLRPLWQKQPLVIIGSFLDWESKAPIYRKQMGLDHIDLTCLKFSPNRQQELIQVYLPERLPLPNTPQFQEVIREKIRNLVSFSSNIPKPIVLIIDDIPLKARIGSAIAAEFGTRVKVESTNLPQQGILVSGWDFWRSHQDQLPPPHLLVIATLPIPSLENPLVAARVAYHKRMRQDWFRLYLLPTALREIQRAVLPLRESQGILVILDNRVNHRSYGQMIMSAIEPCARYNYLDPSWFGLGIN